MNAFTKIEKKLHAGKYKSIGTLRSAIARAKVSPKESKALTKLGDTIFLQGELQNMRVRKRPAKRGRTGRPAQHFHAVTPWAVAFHRVVTDDEMKGKVLDFLRAALDSEITLPDLVESMELI